MLTPAVEGLNNRLQSIARPSTAPVTSRISSMLENTIDLPGNSIEPSESSGPLRRSSIGHTSEVEVDELPVYSRRESNRRDVILRFNTHSYTTRSKKLNLVMEAPGEKSIILIGAVQHSSGEESQVVLGGTLRVNLASPESITHIRIRVKGLVRLVIPSLVSSPFLFSSFFFAD